MATVPTADMALMAKLAAAKGSACPAAAKQIAEAQKYVDSINQSPPPDFARDQILRETHVRLVNAQLALDACVDPNAGLASAAAMDKLRAVEARVAGCPAAEQEIQSAIRAARDSAPVVVNGKHDSSQNAKDGVVYSYLVRAELALKQCQEPKTPTTGSKTPTTGSTGWTKAPATSEQTYTPGSGGVPWKASETYGPELPPEEGPPWGMIAAGVGAVGLLGAIWYFKK